MAKWKLHSCTRCNGDVFVESDEDGDRYEECLQCGYRKISKQQKAALNGQKQRTQSPYKP